MPDLFQLYEGHIRATEHTKDGKWILLHTKENKKPVAFQTLQEIPKVKSKISVEASEGRIWYFANHRSTVIIEPPEPYYPVQDLPNNGRTDLVARIIMDTLQWQNQVDSDDVYDACMKAVGNYIDPETGHWKIDARFLGHGFRYLAAKGLIHKVGVRKSKRVDVNHSREIVVWERVLKK